MFRFRSLAQLCSSAILCLFLARYFYVAESAWQGDTLWIVGLWFMVLPLWAAIAWKYAFRIAATNWIDVGVGLLVAGHLVSAIVVLTTMGDKRSAANLGWEWAGLGCGWWLLRQECQDATFRRGLLIAMIAAGTSMAGLGIYQHYIEFPRLSAKYGDMFDRLQGADAFEAANIRKALAEDNIPIDGPAKILFAKRLRDSREPIGLFALANTLGGYLAVCLILAVSFVLSIARRREAGAWKQFGIWILVILLSGWCLLLTKSRTAWIGTAVGFAIFALRARRPAMAGLWRKIASGAIVVLALAGWGLVRAGGLDLQVLTEAPKSLQYRLQYWSATLPMIASHLIFGVGPGQFRNYYLIYKLPEASEAISDPHNLFLDVAANGGLAAVIGLLMISVALVGSWKSSQDQGMPRDQRLEAVVPVVIVGTVGLVWLWILITGVDDRLLFLLPVAVVLNWGLHRSLKLFGSGTKPMPKPTRELNASHPKNIDVISEHRSSKDGRPTLTGSDMFDESSSIRIGSMSAAIGLIVHLCGAGGIGMPAIGFLLLALVAIADGGRTAVTSNQRPISLRTVVILMTTSLALLIGLYVTGLRPVTIVHSRIAAGDRLLQRGALEAADAEYSAAAAADNWSVEPWRRRAELAYRKSEGQQFRSNDSFLLAVRLLRESKSRDPASYSDDFRTGEWWLSRWRSTKDANDADEAVQAFRHALACYPTNGELMAELALALESAGNQHDAAAIAKRALLQESINRNWGHVDRYLNERVRARLEDLNNHSVQ